MSGNCATCGTGEAHTASLCEAHEEAMRRLLRTLPAPHPDRARIELLDLKVRLRKLADDWDADPHADMTQRACSALLRLQVTG